MINALDRGIKELVKIRIHNEDFGWKVKDRLARAGLKDQIDSYKNSKKSFLQRAAESRICISTYNSTTILECLSMNIPTLIYLDGNFFELNKKAQPYFEKLEVMGILHHNFCDISKKISEVYKDPFEWWNQAEVQRAIKEFCDNYALVKENSLDEWSETLKGIIKQ